MASGGRSRFESQSLKQMPGSASRAETFDRLSLRSSISSGVKKYSATKGPIDKRCFREVELLRSALLESSFSVPVHLMASSNGPFVARRFCSRSALYEEFDRFLTSSSRQTIDPFVAICRDAQRKQLEDRLFLRSLSSSFRFLGCDRHQRVESRCWVRLIQLCFASGRISSNGSAAIFALPRNASFSSAVSNSGRRA